MSDVQEVELGLWELYKAECARDKSRPNMSDFMVWLEEKGYNDDITDLFV